MMRTATSKTPKLNNMEAAWLRLALPSPRLGFYRDPKHPRLRPLGPVSSILT
jgi:hypothetical protein